MLRGESVITLWMGSVYGPASGEVLRILAMVAWLEASGSVVMHSLTGMGRQRTLIPGTFAALIFPYLILAVLWCSATLLAPRRNAPRASFPQ